VARTAAEVGISVPEQIELHGPETPWEPPGDDAGPFVLKPSRSVAGGKKLSVSYAEGTPELTRTIEALPDEAFPLLIQERIQGTGEGIFLLMWNGELRATFAHRRIREKPPSGGVSVVRDSAIPDEDLVEAASNLMKKLDWNGVAMVEFKVEERTRIPYLMEINGRFWGSLQLAVDAGVDFPRLLVDSALDMEMGKSPTYKEGVRCRWLLGDLDHVLARLLRSSSRLDLPPGAPGRAAVVGAFLGEFFSPTARLEILRTDDPRPFFRELWHWFQDICRRK